MAITDPLYPQQWHFSLLGDIEAIWADYTGTGVTVGIYDDGVEASHEDLSGNYDESLEYSGDDGLPNTSTDSHGTAVAGLIGAEANGIGGVGVAYDVTMAAVDFLNDIQSSASATTAAFHHAATAFDIISNSWGSTPGYWDNLDIGDAGTGAELLADSFRYIAANGRGGLGTIITLAAGNEANSSSLVSNYDIYGNAQGDGLNSLFESITVAATDSSGDVTYYSNYGANILVAAPAASVTTDRMGSAGYDVGNYTTTFGGTSAATPVTSGVIALMLDAAPGLGWRDVQNILAASASHTGSAYGAAASGYEVEAWHSNGATNWNGGGMTFNQSYGYGMVDAFAAVRYAEIWQLMNATAATSANQQDVSVSYSGADQQITDNGTASMTISVTEAISIEHLNVTIDLSHTYMGDLTITLVAPDGSRTILFDRELGGADWNGDWTFGLTNLRGMLSAGDWTIEVTDSGVGDTGMLRGVDLDFHGSPTTADTQWHFTDDFLALAGVDAARQIITDGDGGTDWLNFAAIAGDVTLDMASAGAISVGGTQWATFGNGSIENLVLGDGNDNATGNALDNTMFGMRGDDILSGAGGNDSLRGGLGDDTLNGGAGDDFLLGNYGNDILNGGADNDIMFGGTGNDTLDGGAGDDLVSGELQVGGFDAISGQIFRLFEAILDRAPDVGGMMYWAGQEESGAMSLEDIANGFISGPEFQTVYGSTSNSDFVTLLYANVLDRAPGAGGLSYWTGQLDSGTLTRAQVVLGFSESLEFQDNTAGTGLAYGWSGLKAAWSDSVFRLYQATLDRAPEFGGLSYWSEQLTDGTDLESVASGFINSTEFQSVYGSTTNSEFVTLLYANVLNRTPEASGLSYWTGLLDAGTYSRAEVVLGFSESAEFSSGILDSLVAYMRGLGGDDRLAAGAGDNGLFGGWLADTFVFDATQTATDTVAGFEAWDWVELQNSSFADAADALAGLSQTADGVVLVDGSTTILFADTDISDFSADMFLFA